MRKQIMVTKSWRMAESRHAADEIIRHAEVKTLRAGHLQRQITFALALDFLGARKLKFAVVAHVVADYFAEDFVNRRCEEVHTEPAEPRSGRQVVDVKFFAGDGDGGFLNDERNINQAWGFRAACSGDGAVAFEFSGRNPVYGGNTFAAGNARHVREFAIGRNGFAAKQMVAEAEQNHFTRRKILRLENRVAVAFLLVLHGEGNTPGEAAHLFGLAEQRGIFFQPLEIRIIRAAQIIAHHFIFAGLDDDADFLDAGGFEFQQMIMKKCAGDAVCADDGKQFLFHRVRRGKMPRAKAGDGNDSFANQVVAHKSQLRKFKDGWIGGLLDEWIKNCGCANDNPPIQKSIYPSIRLFVCGSHVKTFPTIRAKGVALGAEFNRTGRGAFKNVRHFADAPRILGGDLRDVFLERGDFSKDGHGSAGSAASDFCAVESEFRPAFADGFDEEIHFRHGKPAVVAVTFVRAVHQFTDRHERFFVAGFGGVERLDEFQHAFIFGNWMARRADGAVGGIGLNRGHRIVVRFIFREKIGTKNGFGNFFFIFALEFGRGNFREIIQRGAAGPGADFVDDFFTHERADADDAIGVAGNGMTHHRVDADETGAGRKLHLADNRAGPAKDVRELAFASAGNGDLIHDAARCADDVVLRHLSKPRDAGAVELQIQIRIETRERANFHGGGTADADIHRHRAQK